MKRQCVCLLMLILNVVYSQEDYCFSKDLVKNQIKNFATRTAYITARGTEKEHFNVPECEASKVWILARHGTRNPSASGIEQLWSLVEVHDEIFKREQNLTQLCAEDLEQLRNWRIDSNLTAEYGNDLTVSGWNELKNLAIDYQHTFSNVIDSTYTKEKFRFGYTSQQRTLASYKAFVSGLFGPNADANITIPPELDANSILLRPYEDCPAWEEQGDSTEEESSEFSKFKQTNIFKQTVEEISKRLGFDSPFDFYQIEAIWEMCRFEQAWYNESPWCAALTPKHVEVLEYLEDLDDYVKRGYGGYEINSKIMCEAVQDMLKFLESDSDPKVVGYFSHASAVQLFLTALNYARDDTPLRADNFEQMKNRKYRTSVLSPFGSNLAVVKYDCPKEQNSPKVKIFLNERPIDFEWCENGLCDLSKMVDQHREFLNADCSQVFCGNSPATFRFSTVLVLVAAIVKIFI